MPAKIYRHMSLSEVAQRLEMKPDTLRRRILKIEKATGQLILRRKGEGHSIRYSVTEAQLRRHFPEMFDEKQETLRLWDDRFERLEELIEEASGKVKTKIGELEQSIRSLRARVRELESQAKVGQAS
jgi:DNA-binding transcriptional LysR family regulator